MCLVGRPTLSKLSVREKAEWDEPYSKVISLTSARWYPTLANLIWSILGSASGLKDAVEVEGRRGVSQIIDRVYYNPIMESDVDCRQWELPVDGYHRSLESSIRICIYPTKIPIESHSFSQGSGCKKKGEEYNRNRFGHDNERLIVDTREREE
jgi:hypothetical protein